MRDLRVDDVLTIDGKDFLCEGTINYDEDGHRWVAGRCVDAGEDASGCWSASSAPGAARRACWCKTTATQITGYPPEAIVVGDVRYALDKRGTATCELKGDVGALGDLKKDPRGRAHRALPVVAVQRARRRHAASSSSGASTTACCAARR